MDEIGDLRKTVETINTVLEVQARSTSEITRILVDFDKRLRDLEKAERKRDKSAPKLIVPHSSGAA